MMGIYSLHPYIGLALVNNGVDTPAGSQKQYRDGDQLLFTMSRLFVN
jgi:hypothetical protein